MSTVCGGYARPHKYFLKFWKNTQLQFPINIVIILSWSICQQPPDKGSCERLNEFKEVIFDFELSSK